MLDVRSNNLEQAPVLLVDNFLSRSRGNVSVCEEVAQRLREAGWTVVTTSNKPGRLHKIFDMLRTTWVARDIYRMAQVSVYSGAAFTWAEAVCWMLQRLRKPFVLVLHGGALPDFAERRAARVARLLNAAAVVAVPSEYLAARMQRYRSDIELLPNAIELSAYPFRLRRSPSPRLVWLRSFHNVYNPSMAVRVLKLLTDHFDGVTLTMVGNDEGDGALEEARRLSREWGLESCIEFPGRAPKEEVPEWLSRSDIFLNTTSVDNTPVSMIEAMACGLCVVSTNVGGIPYLVKDESEGLLVDSGDVEGMASAVRRILTQRGLAARLSLNARKRAEHFDWGVILPKWERLLGSLVPQNAREIGCRSGL